MLVFHPTSITVKLETISNFVEINAHDGTSAITFEPVQYDSRLIDQLTLAGQALASSSSSFAPGPVVIEYDTVGTHNLFLNVIAPLAKM